MMGIQIPTDFSEKRKRFKFVSIKEESEFENKWFGQIVIKCIQK